MLEEGGCREWELEEGDGRGWRENGSLRRGMVGGRGMGAGGGGM